MKNTIMKITLKQLIADYSLSTSEAAKMGCVSVRTMQRWLSTDAPINEASVELISLRIELANARRAETRTTTNAF